MNKPYSNVQLYGVTPLYYILMDSKARLDFDTIISYTNIDVALPFIDGVLSLTDTILKVCMGEDVEHLEPEDYNKLRNGKSLELLYNLYSTRALLAKNSLTDIREEGMVSFKLDGVTIALGRLDFEALLELSPDLITQKLEAELHNMSVEIDSDGKSFHKIEEGIQKHKLFLESLSYGIGLIQKRIERIEKTSKRKFTRNLGYCFNSVLSEIKKLDSALTGEINGVKDKGVEEFALFLKDTAKTLGLSTTQQLSSRFERQESDIKKLNINNNNQRSVIPFEDKKRRFENCRVLCNSRIEILKGSNRLSVYYF